MKKSLIIITSLFILGTILQIFSCKTDASSDSDIDSRDKFLGTWTVEESCVSLNYEVNITPYQTDSTRVLIENFAYASPGSPQAYGLVNGIQINIPEQTIGDNWTINGIGTLQPDGKIHWAYYIIIGATGSSCTALYEKSEK